MRIIGIDFGERHIGIAVADDRVPVAVPVTVIDASDDPVEDIARAVEEQQAGAVVMGLPLSLSGAEGLQAAHIREVAGRLSERISVPVHFQDERLTTAQAGRSRGPRSRQDAIAASILLQAYLDGQARR
jgi:putative Holliday junction resolvase